MSVVIDSHNLQLAHPKKKINFGHCVFRTLTLDWTTRSLVGHENTQR